MKPHISLCMAICMYTSIFGAQTTFTKVTTQSLSNGKLLGLTSIPGEFKIQKVQEGVFELSLKEEDSKCSMVFVKFDAKNEEGNFRYKSLGILVSSWCGRSFKYIDTEVSLDDLIERDNGQIGVFYDDYNGILYHISKDQYSDKVALNDNHGREVSYEMGFHDMCRYISDYGANNWHIHDGVITAIPGKSGSTFYKKTFYRNYGELYTREFKVTAHANIQQNGLPGVSIGFDQIHIILETNTKTFNIWKLDRSTNRWSKLKSGENKIHISYNEPVNLAISSDGSAVKFTVGEEGHIVATLSFEALWGSENFNEIAFGLSSYNHTSEFLDFYGIYNVNE